jgi:hypothetical protein
MVGAGRLCGCQWTHPGREKGGEIEVNKPMAQLVPETR